MPNFKREANLEMTILSSTLEGRTFKFITSDLKPKPQTDHFKLKPRSSILKLDILGFSLGAKARN